MAHHRRTALPEGITKAQIAADMAFQRGDLTHQAPPKRAPPQQRELAHQQALAKAISHQWWAPYFSHWPNERQVKLEAWTLSHAGVRRGMPDNWLFLPRDGKHGAVAELKAPRNQGGRKPTKEQLWWLQVLTHCGFETSYHFGWEQQFKFFQDYAGQRRSDDPPPPEPEIDDRIPGLRLQRR